MRGIFCLSLLFALVTAPSAAEKKKREAIENPDATKLLADARAARATWNHFPGFSAELDVNFDGKSFTGKVEVDAKGKVQLQLADDEAARWAKRMLGSIVGHRLPGGDRGTPCFFPDDNEKHPLGRAIQVVADEFHSSYRIRDRQIIEVNRTAKDVRFTITVLENHLNAEKHFLPAHYAVNSWELKGGALGRSESFQQTWQRVGHFDLPRTLLVVAASSGKLEAKELKLSKVQLTAATR